MEATVVDLLGSPEQGGVETLMDLLTRSVTGAAPAEMVGLRPIMAAEAAAVVEAGLLDPALPVEHLVRNLRPQ